MLPVLDDAAVHVSPDAAQSPRPIRLGRPTATSTSFNKSSPSAADHDIVRCRAASGGVPVARQWTRAERDKRQGERRWRTASSMCI
jgi:hypothetical protein